MKWITRERPKIDSLAYPWLIKHFVDGITAAIAGALAGAVIVIAARRA